ncbi:hypothetical protein CFBP3840_P100095 (plasmid) [Pseudomonas syringae]|uniref:Uncharacterized protein n=1 Tax=Pseudomonas syringae TaxID=317 RepID=A0A2K4X3B7_PSESX|nr:hypothetical protein CFBP3840_P100095 [Pseudomonas syringae]
MSYSILHLNGNFGNSGLHPLFAMLRGQRLNARIEFFWSQALQWAVLRPHLENIGASLRYRATAVLRTDKPGRHVMPGIVHVHHACTIFQLAKVIGLIGKYNQSHQLIAYFTMGQIEKTEKIVR